MADLSTHNKTIVDQHNQQAEGYARLTGSLAKSDRTAKLRERIGAGRDDTVLDVACGPGVLTLDLAAHVEAVTGLDITPGMLDQARAAQAEAGCDNVTFVAGDAAAMPFADASFSIVVSSSAFHHFEAPARVLAEMARVCRPGGRVVVSDVMPAPDKTAAYDRMEKLRDPSHGHAHSAAELAEMGAGLGLPEPVVHTSVTGPMSYAAVLEISYPDAAGREELLEMMRQDAVAGTNRHGFSAELKDGEVLVSYRMAQVVWVR